MEYHLGVFALQGYPKKPESSCSGKMCRCRDATRSYLDQNHTMEKNDPKKEKNPKPVILFWQNVLMV